MKAVLEMIYELGGNLIIFTDVRIFWKEIALLFLGLGFVVAGIALPYLSSQISCYLIMGIKLQHILIITGDMLIGLSLVLIIRKDL